jgi:hypothetical protein
MYNDYKKLIDVIVHKNNEIKHLPAIAKMILQFQKKWFEQPNRDKDWEYLNLCGMVNTEFDNLIEKIKTKQLKMKLELTEVKNENSKLEMKTFTQFCTNVTIKDEPFQMHIVKSGWGKPQMYHVLVEFGDMEQTDYHFMSKEQIKKRWGLEFDEVDFVEMVKEYPNDMELGKKIRLIYTTDRK